MLSQLNCHFFYTIMIINNTNKELYIMFTEERHEHILNLLKNNGKVLVKDLSKEFIFRKENKENKKRAWA